MMSPWLSVVLFGLAVFGYAWLSSGRSRVESADGGADPAYDRLLEDLETENRELLDAVAKFKQEQDETVRGLVKQIAVLERQMKAVAEQSAAAASQTAASQSAASQSAAAASQPSESSVGQPEAAAAVAPGEPPGTEDSADAGPSLDAADRSASIRVRYAELLALHERGRSVEQIAKSAGMNKGEVQLILQLARREEEQLA
ncbi:hypothetical protein GE107_00510 [Cohnella sp. CFH 77786]|uniref:hypothetical protein n=1 Tax=Cohnella sp. CFH 77786 TaxID=2662265 RepID=UPI001C60BB34|nr:hypothetical protein [Cohnella sp. CFH 77786]MBW5444546.1 hypothetical protein [Cohnella sp. CFH 77786]